MLFRSMVRPARSRAKKLGIACPIDHNSFEVPNVCPVLGIPLFRKGSKGYSDNAPSLDRINPALGYVQGNIIVVSMRCNRAKNNLTIAELRTPAAFYSTNTKGTLNARLAQEADYRQGKLVSRRGEQGRKR